jgi:hypothetical protein
MDNYFYILPIDKYNDEILLEFKINKEYNIITEINTNKKMYIFNCGINEKNLLISTNMMKIINKDEKYIYVNADENIIKIFNILDDISLEEFQEIIETIKDIEENVEIKLNTIIKQDNILKLRINEDIPIFTTDKKELTRDDINIEDNIRMLLNVKNFIYIPESKVIKYEVTIEQIQKEIKVKQRFDKNIFREPRFPTEYYPKYEINNISEMPDKQEKQESVNSIIEKSIENIENIENIDTIENIEIKQQKGKPRGRPSKKVT